MHGHEVSPIALIGAKCLADGEIVHFANIEFKEPVPKRLADQSHENASRTPHVVQAPLHRRKNWLEQ